MEKRLKCVQCLLLSEQEENKCTGYGTTEKPVRMDLKAGLKSLKLINTNCFLVCEDFSSINQEMS